VTAQQQSQEFVITTNLEAVNYGKNVGSVRPNLIRWGRERDRGLHSSKPESCPRFLTEGKVAPTSGGLGTGLRSGPALLGTRAAPILVPSPSQRHEYLAMVLCNECSAARGSVMSASNLGNRNTQYTPTFSTFRFPLLSFSRLPFLGHVIAPLISLSPVRVRPTDKRRQFQNGALCRDIF
jgi:hypothetical protein